MGVEENKANDLRFWNEALSQHRLEVFDEVFAPDFVDHDALPGQGPGVEGARAIFVELWAALPDLTYKVEDLIAADDRVVVRWSAVGTHEGEIWGAPPSGKTVNGKGITINRYEDGKIVESWTEYDTARFMRDLGLLPS
jgi:steroid delta-isomerase-like uncharacterized protein